MQKPLRLIAAVCAAGETFREIFHGLQASKKFSERCRSLLSLCGTACLRSERLAGKQQFSHALRLSPAQKNNKPRTATKTLKPKIQRLSRKRETHYKTPAIPQLSPKYKKRRPLLRPRRSYQYREYSEITSFYLIKNPPKLFTSEDKRLLLRRGPVRGINAWSGGGQPFSPERLPWRQSA